MYLKNLLRILHQNSTHCSTHSLRKQSKQIPKAFQIESIDPKEWRKDVALVIYRQPIVAPQMSEAERQFAGLSDQLENATSYKCDFEMRMDKDSALIEKRKKIEAEGKDISEVNQELGMNTHQLAEEWRQKAEKLADKYNLNDPLGGINVTDARSLARNLDRKLVLIVKQRFPDAKSADYVSPWILPQMTNGEGETLRQTVKRCLSAILPEDDENNPYGFNVLGNAPIAHCLSHFSNSMRERLGVRGTAIFFYPVQVIHRERFDPSEAMIDFDKDKIVEHKWCTRDELDGQWTNRYRSAIDAVFIE